MTNPTTYGQPLVQPDDVVSRIDSLIPSDEVYSHPLVWRARNIDLALLIDARNEIKRLRAGGCARNQGLTQHCAEAAAAHAEIERLRARVEVLELIRRYMGQGVSWDRAEERAIDEIAERKARAALEATP
jgi:hypothetical protein